MAGPSDERHLFACLANLFDYPQPGLAEVARECEAVVAASNPAAVAPFSAFRGFVDKTPLARIEEIYTGTFDLDATCHPYVGYHLFGESYKRSAFLLGLKERYRAVGYASAAELPDHVAVILRFLAMSEDAGLVGEIVHDALLPALERMVGRAKSAGYDEDEDAHPRQGRRKSDPYRRLLKGLLTVLQSQQSAVSSQQSDVSDQASAIVSAER